MNNTKYKIRHIACNMKDFLSDAHRFRFEYNNKNYIVTCYGAVDIFFDDKDESVLPDIVKKEISELVWNKIDKEELKWSYPKEAYEIANNYC